MAKNTAIAFFAMLFLVFPSGAHSQEILFSAPGGFYDDVFCLSLSCSIDGCTIHYTANGNTPTASSPVYHTPLLLCKDLYSRSDIYTIRNCPEDLWYQPDSVQKCIVIRAAAFDAQGQRICPVATNSYLIKSLGCDTHGLPAVSLCADSLDLFDYEQGILVPGVHYDPENPNWTGNYYQAGRDWERPTNFEFYESGNMGINQQAGLRTHGGSGRRFQQKCLKLYARDEYGKKRFKYQFFKSLAYSNFKHLTLKPFAATWNNSGVNDHICNQIAADLNLECLASRPVCLFLNGEYWGIYYIHEKPDERFLDDHYDVELQRTNLIGNWAGLCEYGSNANFLDLYHWMEDNDLSCEDNYQYLCSQMDIENFIDYQILEIFTANLDWPANNMRCWQEGNSPWRWIFYDGDACLFRPADKFDAFANATYDGDEHYPSSKTSTLFFRKLLENENFRQDFISRFDKLLSTSLSYRTTRSFYDATYQSIAEEIPNQSRRFGNPEDSEDWANRMKGIDSFLSNRASEIYTRLAHYTEKQADLAIQDIHSSDGLIHTTIEAKSGTISDIQIISLMGRRIFFAYHYLHPDTNQVELNIPLHSGVYILKVANQSKKFVVID